PRRATCPGRWQRSIRGGVRCSASSRSKSKSWTGTSTTSRTTSGLSGRATWSTATASSPTISSASPAAAGRPSSPTTKSTAAPSPAAATSSASNSSTASERRARHLSAVEGHHLLSAIAELREAFGACCSPSLPTPSPCPSSCYQRTGLFPPFAGYRRRGSVPRLGTRLPGRRLDEAGRYEVRIEFGDLVHVVFGPKPLGDVVGAWSG